MLELLKLLGFQTVDIFILIASPILGVLGALVHTFTTDIDYSKTPKLKDYFDTAVDADKKLVKTVVEHRGVWILSRLFIGWVTGLVLALYLLGSLKTDLSSLGRILALSVLAGYVAPSFWRNYGNKSINIITKSQNDTQS